MYNKMLRIQVCATNMGGFLNPKFSEQGSIFGTFSLNTCWPDKNLLKIVRNG